MGTRIALMGASGTGKTKLRDFISEKYGLTVNPVGSRSVSQAMGFASPYDVDAAGKRAEFQRRLIEDKIAWELDHEDFVADRTTLDSLVYTMFHDIYAADAKLVDDVVQGLKRCTHIIYCPVETFCNPGGDAARVQDLSYHRLYDIAIRALFEKYRPTRTSFTTLHMSDFEERQRTIAAVIG